MPVLDEQLLGRNIEAALSRWYRGSVRFITDLRPGTVIKDEAIPDLLRQQHQATFLTINEPDFWRKVAIDDHFCVFASRCQTRAHARSPICCARSSGYRLFEPRRAGWERCCGLYAGRSATIHIGNGKYECCHCEVTPYSTGQHIRCRLRKRNHSQRFPLMVVSMNGAQLPQS